MASEPAEPTTRPQDDRVGTVRRLGNSWFVKLVEPASEPWHVVCSDGQQDVSGWQDDESMEDCPVVGYLPVVECVPSLLADPAQTTELLSPEVSRTILGLGRDWAAARRAQAVAEERELAAERREALRQDERDALQARYEALSLEIGVASGREWVRAERLSLLLRGMARKLVAYRKWTSGETPTIHRVFNELRREADAADGVTLSAIRLMNRAGQERDRAVAERDERQARIDRAMVEIAAWWGTTQRADRVLMAVKSILSDLSLSALVGDQPPAEEPKTDVVFRRHVYEHGGGICYGPGGTCTAERAHISGCPRLSGVALRAVEEADDAAGDLP